MEHLRRKIAQEHRRPHEVGTEANEESRRESRDLECPAGMEDNGSEHQNHDNVVDDHGNQPGDKADEDDEEGHIPLGELKRPSGQSVRDAGAAEIAGDDPDGEQNGNNVPVNDLEGIHIAHDADEDHSHDTQDGGQYRVDPARDDKKDTDKKNTDG